MSKFCINCGNKIIDEARFCPSCGYKQPDGIEPKVEPVTVEQKVEQPIKVETVITADPQLSKPNVESIPFVEYSQPPIKKKKPADKKNVTGLIKSILLTTLSVLMFAMAFLPIYKVTYNPYEGLVAGDEYNLTSKFNTVDNVILMFDSLHSKTDEEYQESNIYFKLVEMDLNQYDFINNPEENKKVFAKAFKLIFRGMLQSEDYKTTPTIIISGLLSLAYLIVSALLFIFAILKLLFYLNVLKGNANPSLLFKLIFTCLGLLICLSAISANQSKLVKIGGGALTIYIAFGIIFALFITLNAINGEKLKKSTIVKRSISLASSILVIALCFSSVFSAKITGYLDSENSKTATAKIELNYYDSVLQTIHIDEEKIELIKDMTLEEKREYYKELFENKIEHYSVYKIRKGEANKSIGYVISIVLATKTATGIPTLFALTNLFLILALITATGVLSQNLKYFMSGNYCKTALKTNKILSLVFASIAFIINTIFIIFMNNMFNLYLSAMRLSLTAGLIFLIIFGITTLAIPDKKEKSQLN